MAIVFIEEHNAPQRIGFQRDAKTIAADCDPFDKAMKRLSLSRGDRVPQFRCERRARAQRGGLDPEAARPG
ncbi:hypothetical protein [Bosea sp. (in: a-proteobacteria)]|uniref:hypothetical protein n=1 Tax=Bosea sp. (in: a-proteobacteria) TaxID=1871050 RepID=UPI003F7216A2